MRGPAALVLVAFALLAGPTPEAVAQTPPRPGLQELWRQFPLETRASTRQAPAERESPPSAAASATGAAEEGREGSLVTVQIAATVLAMALVLMLTTATLASAVRGSFQFGGYRRRRRLTPSFRAFVEAPPNAEMKPPERKEPGAKRMVRVPSRAPRGVKRTAAAKSLASIVSEVDALKAKLDVDAGPKKPGSTASDEVENLKAKLDVHPAPEKSQSIARDELETLKEKLAVQPAHGESAPPDEPQTLKEKLEMQRATAKSGSTPYDELEKLKAKLAKQAAFGNVERETADEVALKEKLGGDAAAARRETTVRPALETKLVDHDPGPKSERKVDLHVGKPSPKLDVSDASAKDQARGSVDVDAPDRTLSEPPGDRAAVATPEAPRRVSAATRRSTIAELLSEHGSDLAFFGMVVIMLALLLLNIAVVFDIGVAS